MRVTDQPADLPGAAGLVVPGQGHFRQVMEAFDASGFREPLLRAVGAGTPLLGICVGMQMLLSGSEEAPGMAGLGLIKGVVKRFEGGAGRKVPQMGWNSLEPVGDSPLLRDLRTWRAGRLRLFCSQLLRADRHSGGSRGHHRVRRGVLVGDQSGQHSRHPVSPGKKWGAGFGAAGAFRTQVIEPAQALSGPTLTPHFT